jgi:Disulphide bond corrector protein DsbC
LFLPFCSAQTNVLSVAAPAKVTARRGATLEVKTQALLSSGYHVNSNTPSEAYLIPLRLSWEPGALEAVEVVFPKPQMEKYDFSPVPLSVFTGNFELVTKFKVAASAANGPGMILGKLRYQACNNNSCLPPRVIDVRLPVVIQ